MYEINIYIIIIVYNNINKTGGGEAFTGLFCYNNPHHLHVISCNITFAIIYIYLACNCNYSYYSNYIIRPMII